MALPPIPKNPKAEELLPVLTALDTRITAIEEYVVRNDNRITALETYAARVIQERGEQIDQLEHAVGEYQAGTITREQQITDLRKAVRKIEWLGKRRRSR